MVNYELVNDNEIIEKVINLNGQTILLQAELLGKNFFKGKALWSEKNPNILDFENSDRRDIIPIQDITGLMIERGY